MTSDTDMFVRGAGSVPCWAAEDRVLLLLNQDGLLDLIVLADQPDPVAFPPAWVPSIDARGPDTP